MFNVVKQWLSLSFTKDGDCSKSKQRNKQKNKTKILLRRALGISLISPTQKFLQEMIKWARILKCGCFCKRKNEGTFCYFCNLLVTFIKMDTCMENVSLNLKELGTVPGNCGRPRQKGCFNWSLPLVLLKGWEGRGFWRTVLLYCTNALIHSVTMDANRRGSPAVSLPVIVMTIKQASSAR